MGKRSTPLVLVVDDLSSNVQLLGQILDQAGYHVIPALNGAEALARAEARKPDLVLLDMRMPGMDGFEVCRRLHELPGLADLPVIFVTAAIERELLPKAFDVGAVDYITKPFLVEELLARIKTHIELKQARDHLSLMLQERDDIVDVVAHDLKNPLTCISFNAQMLARDPTDPAHRMELVREVMGCTEDALRFIMRYLTRSAEGEYRRQFSAERFDLREQVQDAIRFQRAAAQVREVAVQLDGDTVHVSADPLATRHVLQNLISNAIHHSPAGEAVEVAIGGGRGGFGRCLVMDRGPGISEADQKLLFKRFMRLATAKEASDYSTGLGLAIAKHDISQMGGFLWYEAREGGGSVFGFELPVQVAPPSAT